MKKLLLTLVVFISVFALAYAQNAQIDYVWPNACRAGASVTLSGQIANKGSSTITSAVVSYSIDGSTPVSQTFNGLNCGGGGTFQYTFTTKYQAPAGKANRTLTMKIPTINGQPNQNSSATTGQNSSFLCFVPSKPVLVEYFTSPSCHWCAVYDGTLEATCLKDEDFVNCLMYPTASPGPDPMSNSSNSGDIGTRASLYGCSGTPKEWVEGTNENQTHPGLLQYGDDYDVGVRTGVATVMQIDNPSAKLVGSTLTCSATAHAIKAVSGNVSGFIAVTEELVTSGAAQGTNGQTSWRWVVKKILPHGTGTSLGSSFAAGATQPFSGTWTLANVYDNSQLRVVFFIQNMSTKEVYFSSKVTKLTGIEENKNISIEDIYPNPSIDIANINFNLIKPEKISLRVYDMLGKTMLTKDLGLLSIGKNHFALNTNDLNSGMYFIELISGTSKSIKKISVIR